LLVDELNLVILKIMNALEDVMLRILIIVAVCSMALGIFENGWLKVKIKLL